MKLIACYGSKPRGSKTSKKQVINGIPCFLHYSKSSTNGNIIVYSMIDPYPRICIATGNTYYECLDRVNAFFEKHSLEISMKLSNLDTSMCFPKDAVDKAIKNRHKPYEIFDDGKCREGTRLIIGKEGLDYKYYLRVYPDEVPRSNGSILVDDIVKEWKERNKSE